MAFLHGVGDEQPTFGPVLPSGQFYSELPVSENPFGVPTPTLAVAGGLGVGSALLLHPLIGAAVALLYIGVSSGPSHANKPKIQGG